MSYSPTKSPLPFIKDLVSAFLMNTPSSNFLEESWNTHGQKEFLFSRSSHALRFLAKLRLDYSSKERISIWIPAYFCDESLLLLRNENVKIFFYPILDNGSPNIDEIQKKLNKENIPDLLLVTHFFGKVIDLKESIEFANSLNAWIVEDGAHLLKKNDNLGFESDFLFYSPHKLIAVPDGSILLMNQKTLSHCNFNRFRSIYEEYIDNSASNTGDLILWIIKRLMQKTGLRKRSKASLDIFKDINKENNEAFQGPRISILSLKLLSLFDDFDYECVQRKTNYIFWRKLFLDNELYGEEIFSLGEAECPYMFAIRFEDESELSRAIQIMNDKHIPVSSWPDLPREVLAEDTSFKDSIDLKRQTIFLPIHSSLRADQI